MCSDSLKAKDNIIAEEDKENLTDEDGTLAEFEAHIVRSIKQSEAGLGKTFDDKDNFLNYLRNL